MAELDMVNRDPNNLNSHCSSAWEDVIGEPEGVRTIDCCWSLSYKCFNLCRDICYNIMAVLCACPLAMCWGCEFASITFHHVWCITPCLRIFMINCGCAQKFCGTCLQCCLAPLCETFGLFFSNIVVKNS